MGDRTQYTPGTFSWTDLTTTDQDAAKSFYGELFGWEATDNPVGDGIVYSMMKLDGKDVCAISPQPQQQRDAGAPPVWNSYVTVQSADQALERAQQLGATVHAPAFDVMEAGRMGVVQDPNGAFFLVWEPGQHIGAALVNAPGALSWNELASPDLDASAGFYAELFGWTIESLPDSPMPYLMIQNAGKGNGGIRAVMPPGTPRSRQPPARLPASPERAARESSGWLVYFGIDDVEAGIAKVSELGGTQIMEPTSIGVGTIAVVQDPQGAAFALYAGRFEA